MNKKLNSNIVREKLSEYGINQTELSSNLNVTKQSVSLWLNNETFPRPAELLKLGKLLKLKYSELVEESNQFEPQVAFRKVGSAKTKDIHLKKAKELGFALENLVEFLPDDMMIKSGELKEPKDEYKYLQSVSTLIRNKFGINKLEVSFDEVINILNSFKAILIPVMLGDKKNHENAIHIFLPKSQTTWIYINLDTKIFDFKFWLAHELGHILSPSLKEKESEDFADNFAGAFLFPAEAAQKEYYSLIKLNDATKIISSIIKTAEQLIISPITILTQVNQFAKRNNLEEIELGNSFYAANTNFNKNYELISDNLFQNKRPTVSEYIKICERTFETIFFKLLKDYNLKYKLNANYISSLINISYIDSVEIFNYIVKQNGTN
jgi:transcriptional regulator with XRE-family HTH domain